MNNLQAAKKALKKVNGEDSVQWEYIQPKVSGKYRGWISVHKNLYPWLMQKFGTNTYETRDEWDRDALSVRFLNNNLGKDFERILLKDLDLYLNKNNQTNNYNSYYGGEIPF